MYDVNRENANQMNVAIKQYFKWHLRLISHTITFPTLNNKVHLKNTDDGLKLDLRQNHSLHFYVTGYYWTNKTIHYNKGKTPTKTNTIMYIMVNDVG